MPKYGTIDSGLTTLSTQELYEQNKQDTQQREERFIDPQQDFANTIQTRSKYGTPIEEPIGNMFIPFGGVKPVDENAIQDIEDLQDIPEARAQSQTTGKLIANSLGQTLNELTVGLGYGVAQLFDDDIAKTNAGDQNFENAASAYFKDIQNNINEDVFPIYQTHKSEESNFMDKLGDGTWWASNFPQIASTAQMLIPALGTSSAIRMLGEVGKKSRIAKMLTNGLSIDAALAKDAEFINTIGSIGAAGTSRHIENNMEASQTFQQVYQEAMQNKIPEDQAKKLAGEAAARNWKYNLALLSSDILQYSTLLKPFKSFGKIAEGLQTSKLAKIAKPLTVAIPESIEEATQFITSAEAGQNKPFDADFFSKRLADYIADPQLQTAAYWGGLGGSGMYASGPLMRKISQASANLATGKITAATFGDIEKAKNLDQDTFNDLLSRNYSINKLDRMESDMKAFHDDYVSKPDITPEEKQEIGDKYKDWTNQVSFVKETDKNALSDPKFQKNPETRKSFVLQQLEAKNLAEDISTNKGIIDSYYSELPSAYNDVKSVNKEVNKLKALKSLQKSVKASNFHDIKKGYHLNDIEKQIIIQEAKVNSAKESYRTSTGKEYAKQILPQEFIATVAHSRLERDQFKHDNIIQPELLKYQSDSEEKIAEKEQEITKKQKETNKKAAEEAVESAETSEDIEDITSVIGSEEFEANNPPEVAEAIFGKINKKAKEETVNKGKENLDAINNLAEKISKGAIEFSPEELQLQANHPKELEEALINLKNASKLTSPITKNRWDNSVHKFTAEKVGFMGKLISLEDKTPEETSMIKKLGSSRKDAMYANLVEAQKYPRIAQEINNFFNQQDKLQSKSTEEKELDKQINKLQSNPVDTDVEGTIEPSVNFTTIILQKDIEAKKADIERRKQKEILNRIGNTISQSEIQKRFIEKRNSDKVQEKLTEGLNHTNGSINPEKRWIDKDDAIFQELVDLGVKPDSRGVIDNTAINKAFSENESRLKKEVNEEIKQEGLKRVTDEFRKQDDLRKFKEINAKYDAELEALDKIVITEKSNVFHINASQYKVNNIGGKRQIVGDKLPFANQFNWEVINNLPIGSELTARIDPDHIVYVEGKPLKNSEVAPNQQLVSLFSEDEVEVGILYTQNEANKALFPVWRSEVQNKGEKKFKVIQKYKGDINTYTEIKDGDITIPAARNSLTDIERAYGKKLILGYVHGTTAGSIVRTPNKDIPEIRLGAKNKSGQIVVALPKGNGEYMAYGLVTKSLKQGEGVDYKNVPLVENNAFREVLDSLKGLQVGNIEGNEILIDKLHSFVSLPTIISTNKKTGTPYIQFNPVHIKKKHLEAFKNVKGINSYLREDKKDGDPGAYVVLVSKDIIDNLQLTEYDKGTPEAVMMDFLGEMKLQIDGSKLNQDDYYETVSKRTKTNLANDPVVNVSFFIQPTTDEVQLTPKEVDTTVQKSKTKDISDIKKEEELPTKELKDTKTNITEVSNLDQTDGKPVKIETPAKRGKTTLVRKPAGVAPSNVEELKKDIELRRQEELSDIRSNGLYNWFTSKTKETPYSGFSSKTTLINEINAKYDQELANLGKLSTGRGNYKVWNKEKELNWLSKQLPNIPVEVFDGITDLQEGLDVDVYGRFENSLDVLGNPLGTIKLAENTKVGTTYHEAFHTVFWVGLNSRQRKSVLKDARNKYGEFSDDTLEEMMADDFIPYVETEGTVEVKGNFIKSFFEKIYNWIKYNVFGQVEIKNLYYKINSGQYANLKPVKVNVSKLSSSLRPAIFEDRVNTLVANFSLAIDDYIDEHKELVNLTRTQLLKSIDNGTDFNNIEYFLAQAYNNLKKDYESDPDSTWGKQMATFLNETVKAVTTEGKILWGPIGKKALQKIGSREGFKVHANQILGVQNANPDEEYGISEEETRSEGWQVDVKSQSGQMGLSNEVRKELSYIPLTGDKAVDDLGYQRYVDFDTVYATLKRELADLYTAERIEKKLQEITSTTRPELIEVYNKFISEEPNNKLFRTKFVNDFAKTHVDFKMAVQKNDGRVAIYSSNSTTIVNMIIDNWQSEFYNNGYFTPDGNVNVDKITPIINEILKAPTVVEKMKLFNDKFNLDLDSRVFNNISQDMLYLIGDLKSGNNIFETNTSKLKDLAKLDAKYKTDLLESSFRNIEGKTVYSHILPSFTSKQIANMKYDFDTWYNYYSTDPFYKNSPLLNAILKDKSILDNLEYSMIDGSKYKGESEGTSYADFSDKQFLSMQINMFHNNGAKNYGWYQTPILSDSPEGVYIKLPKYKTAEALDKLVEVAKQEYERIKDSHDNKLGVKNFDENANKFLFMTFLRRSDLEKSDEEIKEIIRKGLGNKFNDYWDFLQKNNIFDLSDNLGVTRELIPNYFKIKAEKRTTLTEEELNEVKNSIWNYFLNQVYAGSQIITLTTGDPAFYSSVTDYYKRAKEIVSPTMQIDTSAVYILSEEEINNEGNTGKIATNVKDGVDFIFEQNSELNTIGTQQQYSAYLDAIFPDSKVKDIVYHGSKSDTEFDKFQLNKDRLAKAFFFAKDVYNAKQYSRSINVVSAILDMKNPDVYTNKSHHITTTLIQDNKINKNMYDGVITIDPDPKTLETFNPMYDTVFDITEYAVFEPEQIHILGSKQDIEGFKNFVKNSTKEVNQVITPGENYNTLYVNDVKTVGQIGKELFDNFTKTGDIFYAQTAAKYGYNNFTDENGKRFVKVQQKELDLSSGLQEDYNFTYINPTSGAVLKNKNVKLSNDFIINTPDGYKIGKLILEIDLLDRDFEEGIVVTKTGNTYELRHSLSGIVLGKGNLIEDAINSFSKTPNRKDSLGNFVTENIININKASKLSQFFNLEEGIPSMPIIKKGSDLHLDLLNTFGKTYLFPATLVNVADAQTFISPNRYRKVAVGYGRWNKQIQQTFGRMVSNKTLLPEDYDVAIQPYKPFVFGHIKQGNKIVPVQNKNSEMTLFPQLAKASPTLQKLYDIMQENNLDSISFESVVKVGLSNTVSWEDLQNGVDIKDKIHTLDNSNYGLQQEVPAHYIDDSALFGTQIMKHIIANLDLTADYNGRTGQELADYFQKLISENVETSYEQAREELGLSGDIVDNKKLSEILQREIISRDLGEDIFEAAGLDINGEFNIHPADPLHNDRNEKLLNSIYKNRVTKQKIKGGSFVQASGIGFMGELQLVLNESGNAIQYAECMLPWSSRRYFEPFMDKDGLIDINKVPLDLLDMIGYRIPTEDKYSMLPLRVVDFLPAQMGGVVMLPMEITTLAGSDFDVDKLYIMMPEFEISQDKQDIRKITDLETTEGRNNMLIDLMRDVLTNEKTFKQFIKPGGFVDLQRNANIIYLVAEKAAKYSEIIDWSDKQINDAVESLIAKQGIDLTSPLSNARMFNRNMTGKKLVGIEANHNANHSILQFTNIELSKPIIIDGKIYKSLHDIYNNAGELISNNVAQRLAAVVDNAKDPNAFKANLNTYTADVDALLTRLGVPMIQSFALLKQPIVVELTRLYYLHGGDFNAEETAIKEIYDNYPGGYVSLVTNNKIIPDLNKIKDPDITQETLLDNLSKNWKDESQLDVFIKFLIYKNRSKSLADLIRSMGSMTNGAGPTLADNEIVIRNQRQILADENLVGVAELFSGAKYPLFKAFNDNGLINPQEDLKKVFPLGNTDEKSWVNKTKLLLQNSIAKNKLSAKDLNKFNNFILSYISDGFELYDPKLQKYFVESFPAKYKEALELNPELKEFRITKFIKFQQDDDFPFGRLEFNSTGALTNTLKDDLKDSWYQMFTDDNPETRKFALNVLRYSKYKEGFLFGPKTYTHLQPTKFFTSTEEGKAINKAWKKVFKAENLDMNDKDSERVVKQYIRNNWKNTGFVPIITESHKVTKEGDNPIAVNVNIKDSKYKTDTGFVEFVKVPVSTSKGKKVETSYILMEKVYQTYNKQGQPITAVYRPTNKLGKSAYLVETNRMLDNFSSILPENNISKVADVDIRKLANSATVEEINNTFESEENDVSLQEESKTLKDILESFELYESMFAAKGVTRESLTKMSEEELGKLLKEIC